MSLGPAHSSGQCFWFWISSRLNEIPPSCCYLVRQCLWFSLRTAENLIEPVSGLSFAPLVVSTVLDPPPQSGKLIISAYSGVTNPGKVWTSWTPWYFTPFLGGWSLVSCCSIMQQARKPQRYASSKLQPTGFINHQQGRISKNEHPIAWMVGAKATLDVRYSQRPNQQWLRKSDVKLLAAKYDSPACSSGPLFKKFTLRCLLRFTFLAVQPTAQ